MICRNLEIVSGMGAMGLQAEPLRRFPGTGIQIAHQTQSSPFCPEYPRQHIVFEKLLRILSYSCARRASEIFSTEKILNGGAPRVGAKNRVGWAIEADIVACPVTGQSRFRLPGVARSAVDASQKTTNIYQIGCVNAPARALAKL